jgi:putative ATP-binding cassette transporter
VLKARGKTVLVISHDDRYYHVGDRIIKIDYGQFVYDVPAGDLSSTMVQTPVAAMI